MTIVKTCYDKVLPWEINRPQRFMTFGDQQRAVIVFRKMWITGSTLQVRFLEGSAQQKDLVIEQAGWWSEHANLNFEINDATNADIRIAFEGVKAISMPWQKVYVI